MFCFRSAESSLFSMLSLFLSTLLWLQIQAQWMLGVDSPDRKVQHEHRQDACLLSPSAILTDFLKEA